MWTITATQDEGAFLDDLITDVIEHPIPSLPTHDQKIGHVEVHWHQVASGLAYVAANPDQGTPADRRFAESIVLAKLQPHGLRQATIPMYWDHSDLTKQSTWGDIEAKARRLVQTGAVTLLRNGANSVISQVQGDGSDNGGKPDMHRVEISRQDPNSQAITGSFCDCGWGQFQNLPRTRQWKRFQNRPCAHILATYWLSKAVPMDEDRAPGNNGPGQMSLFDMSGGQAPGSMGLMKNSPFASPNAWFMQPGAPPNAFNQGMPQGGGGGLSGPMQAPPPESVLPQFPMDPSMMPQVNPASVPGGRPGPTSTNPIQYPGGTFSSVRYAVDQQYQNGELVRLNKETVGIYVGRPESGMAGQQTTIPAGSVGEVRGTDPTTQMVEVLFMGKQFNQMSYFEPFGATAWCWPSEISPSGNTPPGPAIRRT